MTIYHYYATLTKDGKTVFQHDGITGLFARIHGSEDYAKVRKQIKEDVYKACKEEDSDLAWGSEFHLISLNRLN